MKRMITITLIMLFCTILTAPPSGGLVVFASESINPYERLWQATCQVESSGNPFAIGDRHLKHKSYGIVQIRATRLDDYYRRTGIRYTTTDMFDVEKSKKVFLWYAMQGKSEEEICRNWNGGHKGMQKKSTVKYWNKIKAML